MKDIHKLSRRTDPESSKEAAAVTAPHIETVRWRVKEILKGSEILLTHDDIIRIYNERYTDKTTDSSIRTRCKELQRAGSIQFSGFGESARGNKAQLFEYVEKSDELVAINSES